MFCLLVKGFLGLSAVFLQCILKLVCLVCLSEGFMARTTTFMVQGKDIVVWESDFNKFYSSTIHIPGQETILLTLREVAKLGGMEL